MYEFNLVLLLLQQMCVFLVIAWLMSKTPLFIPLMQVTVRLPHKFLCYIVFSIFCIMGTWFGLHIDDSIANTRAIGAVMGGLLGGPVVGGLVGLTGGLHRYSMCTLKAGRNFPVKPQTFQPCQRLPPRGSSKRHLFQYTTIFACGK